MKRIAVLTSGGDSPGMNACIRAVVRAGCSMGLETWGIMRGYQGMIENDLRPLPAESVGNIIQYGGTILKSARSAAFRTPEGRRQAYENLRQAGIEGLVCIGGDGSYTGAKVFFEEYGIPSIGCPGTIDNDLYGTDYTIGFDTAVNTALDAIDRVRDTADSHNRVFFIEVMGRDSGHIALYSGLAGGSEGIFVPERNNEFQQIVAAYGNKNRQKAFSIFIVAEGDEEGKAYEVADEFRKVYPDADARVTVLGHIQRGGKPTANDRILASRLGAHAVKGLVEGRSNEAVGVVNNVIVYTPFSEAIGKHKDINEKLWELSTILTR